MKNTVFVQNHCFFCKITQFSEIHIFACGSLGRIHYNLTKSCDLNCPERVSEVSWGVLRCPTMICEAVSTRIVHSGMIYHPQMLVLEVWRRLLIDLVTRVIIRVQKPKRNTGGAIHTVYQRCIMKPNCLKRCVFDNRTAVVKKSEDSWRFFITDGLAQEIHG